MCFFQVSFMHFAFYLQIKSMRMISLLAMHTCINFNIFKTGGGGGLYQIYSYLTSTSFVNMKLESYKLRFSMLRQMIDQETITPFALIKNVHALVVDVNLLKKGLAVSETTIVRQQQTVQETQNGHN